LGSVGEQKSRGSIKQDADAAFFELELLSVGGDEARISKDMSTDRALGAFLNELAVGEDDTAWTFEKDLSRSVGELDLLSVLGDEAGGAEKVTRGRALGAFLNELAVGEDDSTWTFEEDLSRSVGELDLLSVLGDEAGGAEKVTRGSGPLLSELDVLTTAGDGAGWANEDDVMGLGMGELPVVTVGSHDARGSSVTGYEVGDRNRGMEGGLGCGQLEVLGTTLGDDAARANEGDIVGECMRELDVFAVRTDDSTRSNLCVGEGDQRADSYCNSHDVDWGASELQYQW